MPANPSYDRACRLPLVTAALDALGPEVLQLSGANVLVTGARGFFGRYVIELLLEQNRRWRQSPANTPRCTITAMDSHAGGVGTDRHEEWRNEENLYFVQHDVRHNTHHAEGKLTHVWHLAGIASPYWYKKLPEETIAVAVDGTRNMLNLAKEHGARFMLTSSSEVYQTADIIPTPESFVGAIPSMNDRSCYDVSKLMAETLCYVAATKHGQHASVVRIFNSFGPGMSEADRRILPRIASAMMSNREMQVYGSVSAQLPKRTYTPVANTLLGFMKVALVGEPVGLSADNFRKTSGVYNVGIDDDEMDVVRLLKTIAKVTSNTVPYRVVPPPENYETEPQRRCPDVTRLRSIGWQPCMDLETGLKHFFNWAMETYAGEA